MSHQRILIVDDDRDFGDSLAEALGLSGLSTDTATSAAEALRMVESAPYEVALIDVVMPGTDGVTCMDRILDARPNTRVGIMTGFTVPDRIEQALELGAASVIQKPIDTQALIGSLNRMCSAPVALVGMTKSGALRMLKSEMERVGFNVVTALNESTMREIANSGGVDLAVLDSSLMANARGETLARLFEPTVRVPLVVFSTNGPPADALLVDSENEPTDLRVLVGTLEPRDVAREARQFYEGRRKAR